MSPILTITQFWGDKLVSKSAVSLGYAIEPFLPNIWDHATLPRAFPPQRSPSFQPYNLDFTWTDEQFDQDFLDVIKQSTQRIKEAAIRDGQLGVAEAPVYPNYALSDTPLEDIYGDNVTKLRMLKERVDPENVMELTGGFKF